ALLNNLNAIDSDLIFIKNIDNVQHESRSQLAIEHLKYLGGLLTAFKSELKEILESEDCRNKLGVLNLQYQFMDIVTDFENLSDDIIQELAQRPIRICGMVRNEGQPGGGPFWVKENGTFSKQIVEKSQIDDDEQY